MVEKKFDELTLEEQALLEGGMSKYGAKDKDNGDIYKPRTHYSCNALRNAVHGLNVVD
jgi:hypothetical protein